MTNQGNFLECATDLAQYDSPELHWDYEGFADAPVRVFLWERLRPALGDLRGRSVLDVGTGTAWLPYRMREELGADDVTALEPSETQRELARRFNASQPIEPVGLLDYETDQTFNLVTAIMVFEHMHPLEPQFRKLHALTHPGSQLFVIMADKGNFLTQRTDYAFERQEVDPDTVVIRAVRTYGVLHDVVRPTQTLVSAAEQQGFALTLHQPLAPDEALRQAVSRYQGREHEPICHLLGFERVE
jgi:SAM-dependent methyltransferase